jgi:hypothetical protein
MLGDVDLFHAYTLFATFDVNPIMCKRFSRFFIFGCRNGSLMFHLACRLCSIVQVIEFFVVIRAIQPIHMSGIMALTATPAVF